MIKIEIVPAAAPDHDLTVRAPLLLDAAAELLGGFIEMYGPFDDGELPIAELLFTKLAHACTRFRESPNQQTVVFEHPGDDRMEKFKLTVTRGD